MKFPIIQTSKLVSGMIIVVSLILCGFLLLFGIANLIHPDVPDTYLRQNTIACSVVCLIGLAFLLLATASFRGIMYKQ